MNQVTLFLCDPFLYCPAYIPVPTKWFLPFRLSETNFFSEFLILTVCDPLPNYLLLLDVITLVRPGEEHELCKI
jgi:hypothetical protein